METSPRSTHSPAYGVAVNIDADWDAGDLGCGHLLIELRKRLKAMPGGVMQLTSRDPGSPYDLPVWCRLTQNELLKHDPENQRYWIRSKINWD